MQLTHSIQFRSTQLTCIESEGEFYVAVRPIVEDMGLSWSRQRKKILANAKRFSVVVLKATTEKDGKQYEMLCIPLARVFGWLMTIHSSRVKPECREAVIEYQNECDLVLSRYFIHELRLLHDDAEEWGTALFNGWLKRYPKWGEILDGINEGETYQQIMDRTGYRSKSTISRNIQRMREAGVLTVFH